MIHSLPALSTRQPCGRGRAFIARFFALVLAVALLAGLVTPHLTAAASRPQAVIIDPFPEQHSPGYDQQSLVSVLQAAGFKVTTYIGSAVTVEVMKHLNKYKIVYLFTHAGPLPNKDAAVSTGDTRRTRYKTYFKNYSLVQMHIMSAKGRMQNFDAITGRFLLKYSPRFQSHSLVFLNSCTALEMQRFVKDLKSMGLSTFVSWAHHVTTVDADNAGIAFFKALSEGKTVDQAMHVLKAEGIGLSYASTKIGTIGYRGSGKTTMKQMGAVKLPTPTATKTPIATSTPAPTITPTPTSTSTNG